MSLTRQLLNLVMIHCRARFTVCKNLYIFFNNFFDSIL